MNGEGEKALELLAPLYRRAPHFQAVHWVIPDALFALGRDEDGCQQTPTGLYPEAQDKRSAVLGGGCSGARQIRQPRANRRSRYSASRSRRFLNEYLDGRTMFVVNEEPLTRRRVLETFVYGGLAHANAEKKQEYDLWMRIPFIKSAITNEFVGINFEILNVALHVTQLNNWVLEQWSKP